MSHQPPAISNRQSKLLVWTALAALLLLGAYMRLARLGSVNHFLGDQGEYYLAVMRWMWRGEWPLVGQLRSVTGDFTIGPGWFYTFAPALVISGFHPAAGSVTIVLFSLAAAFLSFLWVRRTSGSALAALTVTALFMLATRWVSDERSIWAPYVLPFATVSLAWLLSGFAKNPLRNLALYAALVLILPQWHTTGWILVGISVPFFLWAIHRAQTSLAKTSPKQRLAWGVPVLLIFLALYLPPLIYEFRSDEGNLIPYFINTLSATPPSGEPLLLRVRFNTGLLNFLVVRQFFAIEAVELFEEGVVIPTISAAVSCSVIAAIVLSARRRTLDPSVLFLAALVAAFWVTAVRQGEYFDAYYHHGVLGAPILLGGWLAGRLVTTALNRRPPAVSVHPSAIRRQPSAISYQPSTISRQLSAVGAGVLLIGPLLLTLVQLPQAWSIHRERDHRILETMRIVDYIARDSDGRPFSLGFIEPYGYRSHLHALLWRAGSPPMNENQSRTLIERDEFGDAAYVVIRGAALEFTAEVEGLTGNLPPPHRMDNTWIVRVPLDLLPESALGLEVLCHPREKRYEITAVSE